MHAHIAKLKDRKTKCNLCDPKLDPVLNLTLGKKMATKDIGTTGKTGIFFSMLIGNFSMLI